MANMPISVQTLYNSAPFTIKKTQIEYPVRNSYTSNESSEYIPSPPNQANQTPPYNPTDPEPGSNNAKYSVSDLFIAINTLVFPVHQIHPQKQSETSCVAPCCVITDIVISPGTWAPIAAT